MKSDQYALSLSIHATGPLYNGKEDYSQKCPIWHSLMFLAMNDISVANFKWHFGV